MPDGALGMALVQVLALGGCTAFSSRSNSSTLTHPDRCRFVLNEYAPQRNYWWNAKVRAIPSH